MGRDVTGLRGDKKPGSVNVKPNGNIRAAVHVAPKVKREEIDKRNDEPEDHHNLKDRVPAECTEKQDVLGVKSTNQEPEEKMIKAEAQTEKKFSSPAKPTSNGTVDATSGEPLASGLEAEKEISRTDHANGTDSNDSNVKCSPYSSDVHTPMSAKKLQPNSPLMSRKQLQPNDKRFYDEEDNWSLASSTAASVKSRITVAVAPRFSCVDRLERRKEFYTKLEEKHKALEKEKLEYEARTKEEEQAALRQLRKNMTYKANPVPSFYREGPPPKVELKKLPVTRAKSPNLNSRRKSCGDAARPPQEENKGPSGRATRHSVGVYKPAPRKDSPMTPKTAKKDSPVTAKIAKKDSPITAKIAKKDSPITPKTRDQTGMQKPNGAVKVKDLRPQKPKESKENGSLEKEQVQKETMENSSPEKEQVSNETKVENSSPENQQEPRETVEDCSPVTEQVIAEIDVES